MNLQENINLSKYTTFKVGGPAEFFYSLTNPEDLMSLRAQYYDKLSINFIGGGSNILVPDGGVSGLVIKNELKGITYEEQGSQVLVKVGSGEVFDDLVADCVDRGYWGLENLSSIPGSVGATPVQNVGAYGIETADLIESVKVFDFETGEFLSLSKEDCRFSYRDSVFKTPEGRRYFICEVVFRLGLETSPQLDYKDLQNYFSDFKGEIDLKTIRQAVIEIRQKKFPDWRKVGTAGSFFKNPIINKDKYDQLKADYPDLPGFRVGENQVKISLGWILDKVCKLKGYEVGNVSTFENQALVIINKGEATASEILDFAHIVEEKVFEKIKIRPEWEVTKF